MPLLEKTFAIALTIPDNEAFTALATLRRLGIVAGSLRRADIWTFDVEADAAHSLGTTIAEIETIFNPNKHELDERPQAHPVDGEVWIAAHDDRAQATVGGRAIAGVAGVRRRVAWQIFDDEGCVVRPDVLTAAIETFLCNPAFQKAIR